MYLGFLLTPATVQAIAEGFWILVAIALGVIAHRAVYAAFDRWAHHRDGPVTVALVRRTARPAAYIFPLLAVLAIVPTIGIDEHWKGRTSHVTGLLVIAAIAWACVALLRLWGDVVVARHRIDVADNLIARQLGTRVDILVRTATLLVSLLALGAMLMTFPQIRALGTTLLASAGLIGIVAGIAARPIFENLVAGLQLAFAQPIRIDDVVVVNGYWGKIEEIHMTYVVIEVWDLRRLVVPLSWFINNPFENWTRREAALIGEVHLVADWTLDVGALRAELPHMLAQTPLWDGKVQSCQVVDATDKGIDVRVLVSARNSGDLWDLRCFVREAIVAYVRERQPAAFPRTRIDGPERVKAEIAAATRATRDGGHTRVDASATTGAATTDGFVAPPVRTIKEG